MVWFGFGTKKETPGQENILFWLKAAGVVVLNMRLWFCFHTHTLLFSFAATNTTWNFPDISSEIYHFIAHKAGKRPDISSDTLMKVEMQQIFCKFAAPLTRLEKVPTSRLKHPVVSHLQMLNVVLNSGLWPSPAPQLIFRWRQHDTKPLINTHIWQYWWFAETQTAVILLSTDWLNLNSSCGSSCFHFRTVCQMIPADSTLILRGESDLQDSLKIALLVRSLWGLL